MDTCDEDPLLPNGRGPVPRDRFRLVYIIFYVLGVGSLSPWNFFITASDYFKYKFRNTTLADSEYLTPEYETDLQAMFESYLTVASTIPNLLFNLITALLIKRISLKTRMLSSLSLTIVMFTMTAIFARVNTDTWQPQFFGITMATAVIMNTCSSIMCTSLFGLVSLFPSQYMQATMAGQAVGGIFASVANIVALAIGTHVVESGLGFFIAAAVTALLTLVGYCCLYRLHYSKYHIIEVGDTFNVAINTEENRQLINPNHNCTYYIIIIRKVWLEGLSVCLVFFVTLSCFPAIASSIVSVSTGSTFWSGKYFSAFVCFLLFNCGDWSGRFVAGSVQYPKFGRSTLLFIFCVLRVVFIPILMYCNAQPRHDPVLFDSDIYPIVFIPLLGLTNGYLSTLSMMYGPMRVPPDEAESTGAIMSICLTTGLISGSLFSLLLIKSM